MEQVTQQLEEADLMLEFQLAYRKHHSVVCGVPPGSILGLLLFLLYTADEALLAQRHHVAVHSYADDTHLYGLATDGSTSAAELLHCITDIADWMTSEW